MLRILQIGKYFDPDEGGIETVTRAVSEGLWRMGHRADVLCFSRRREYPPQSWPWTVHRAPTDFRVGDRPFSLRYAADLRGLAGRYDAGLLHMPNPIGAAAVLRWWRKPLVILWHADGPAIALARVIRPLDRAVLRRSAAVIVPARAHFLGSVVRELIEPKAQVIPFPFDPAWLPATPASSPVLDRLRSFARGRRTVLAVGRLVPYKGFDVLIRAAHALQEDLAVCVAGGGPQADELAALIQAENASSRVMLAGRVSAGDLRALYEEASFVTMPSVTRQEMYGLSQVEALAFGRPIISTRIPFSGVPEVNLDGQTGFIVPPGNPAALAAAINRIAADQDLYALMAARARVQFAAQHGLGIFGARCAKLFEAAVAG